MKHSDFQIGQEFWTGSGCWRCTDIGTRTIAAIKLDKEDASWYSGPPYAVAELIFDEYDREGCFQTEAIRDHEIGPTTLPAAEPMTTPTMTHREHRIAASAVRYFAALFYQELDQLNPDDSGIWEYAMDELADVSLSQKGRRSHRDYVGEIIEQPGVVTVGGDGTCRMTR